MEGLTSHSVSATSTTTKRHTCSSSLWFPLSNGPPNDVRGVFVVNNIRHFRSSVSAVARKRQHYSGVQYCSVYKYMIVYLFILIVIYYDRFLCNKHIFCSFY